MKYIIALLDYKERFGSKYYPQIYRQGMDKEILERCFSNLGYRLEYANMNKSPDIDIGNVPIIYTSQEDADYRYKSFIEDIVLALELKGAKTLPSYKYLRATNNKVLMEQLRNILLPQQYHSSTRYFGSFEELYNCLEDFKYPVIVKTAEGAVSKGVYKANNQQTLLTIARKISRSRAFNYELRDYMRGYSHKGYGRESKHRKKFIVQDFIPNIKHDWKVLVYYDKVFVLRRQNRPGDFRASGSGLFSFDNVVDPRLLEAGIEIRKALNIPMVSLDLAFKDDSVILFEFQGVHFGTSTLEKSPYYYTKSSGAWQKIVGKSVLEDVYAKAVVDYLEKGN